MNRTSTDYVEERLGDEEDRVEQPTIRTMVLNRFFKFVIIEESCLLRRRHKRLERVIDISPDLYAMLCCRPLRIGVRCLHILRIQSQKELLPIFRTKTRVRSTAVNTAQEFDHYRTNRTTELQRIS